MKLFLKVFFAAIFLWMTVATIRTSLAVSLWEAWDSYKSNPWAVATLYDAYCGFVTFSVWVMYKERSWAARTAWFLAILALGNIATSAYVLIQLFRLRPEDPAERILFRTA